MTLPPFPAPRHRGAALVLLLAAALAAPALAQAPKLPQSAADSRDALEQACRDDGEDAATCACMGEIMMEHFSARELAGAALMFSEPASRTDPGAALATLLDAGYTLDEITGVAERIAALEDDANARCGADSATRAPDDGN